MGTQALPVTCQIRRPGTSAARQIQLESAVYSALRRARREVVKAQNDYYQLTRICDNRAIALTGPFAQKNQQWFVYCIVWQIELYVRWQRAESWLEALALVALGSDHGS
ncbi:MAG: hypothetical protein AB8B63_13260 [Granulosicoccus sp.]